MNPEHLCMGCMSDKGTAAVCPRCGYDEGKRRSPLILPHRTVLNNQYLTGEDAGRQTGRIRDHLSRMGSQA